MAANGNICIFGLGEAGSLIASDLHAAGFKVSAFDPAPVPTPEGIERHAVPSKAVRTADTVLAITGGMDAMTALTQALPDIPCGTLYADLSTSSPRTKRALAKLCAENTLRFVDVALMAIVPGNGLKTPVLVSGEGARDYFNLVSELEVPVTLVGRTPGEAASRKLLRSVMMKGLAAAVIEAMEAARAANCEDWLWKNIAEQLYVADELFLKRLVVGTGAHAERRLHEMECARDYLEEIAVDSQITQATVASLERIVTQGFPEIKQ